MVLFALFWGKLIWELLGLLFPKGDFAVSFIVMLFGAYIGQVQYLPQCLDVAMVVVMYLTLGQLFRQHQALLDRYRVPLFLAMLIPWAWCCQQGIYIELASRTYSNYILCASISVCGIWIFCHLCRELNANNALRPALSFWGGTACGCSLCTIWMCLPVPSGKRPPSVHAALPHRVGHPAFPAAAWLLDIAAHRLAQADRKINFLNRSASPVPGLQGGFCFGSAFCTVQTLFLPRIMVQ